MIVLGINPGYDSTAALLVDGEIAAVVEEERLSRRKMHLGFPRRAIREVLRLGGVDPGRIDCVTFSFVDYLDAHPLITRLLLEDGGFPFDPDNALAAPALARLAGAVRLEDLVRPSLRKAAARNRPDNERAYLRALRQLGITVDRLEPVDHHLSHAASAYYLSGFDDCLVVTADGCGDGNSMTVSLARGGQLHRIHSSPPNVSAGMLYSSTTAFLGFRAHRHEGKITGLAAFGDPSRCYDHFARCLRVNEAGTGFTSDLLGSRSRQAAALLRGLGARRLFRHAPMNVYCQHHRAHLSRFGREDVAAAVQRRLEDLFVEYLRPIVRAHRVDRLALAGGVFANVRLNQRLSELEGIREIVIHPNMGDGGNALGSAIVAHRARTGAAHQPARWKLAHVYFGPEFSNAEIEAELRRRRLCYRGVENIEAEVAERIANHQVVGRFNGRMEYGPRALGNRSILANPTDARINAVLNQRLRRTEFMPFAPSVLEEDAQR